MRHAILERLVSPKNWLASQNTGMKVLTAAVWLAKGLEERGWIAEYYWLCVKRRRSTGKARWLEISRMAITTPPKLPREKWCHSPNRRLDELLQDRAGRWDTNRCAILVPESLALLQNKGWLCKPSASVPGYKDVWLSAGFHGFTRGGYSVGKSLYFSLNSFTRVIQLHTALTKDAPNSHW